MDADTREVIEIIDDPALKISQISAERFAARLGAAIVKILPTPDENEWKVELRIPAQVRRLHMPLPGDPVRFTSRIDGHELELSGVYQFKRDHAYVILDDSGGEWEVQSMWKIKKLD